MLSEGFSSIAGTYVQLQDLSKLVLLGKTLSWDPEELLPVRVEDSDLVGRSI